MRKSTKKEGPTRFRQLVREHFRRARGGLFLAGLYMLALTVADLLRPWPLKIIFDQILLDMPLPAELSWFGANFENRKVLLLAAISFSIALISFFKALFSFLQHNITSRIGNQMVYTLRRELFTHLQRLSLSFHNRARSGELLTKIAGDTSTLKNVFAEAGVVFISDLLTVIGVFGIMFLLNWKLALIVLASMPLLLWNLSYRYGKAKSSAKRQRKQEETMATRISEVMTMLPLVQAFGRESYEEKRFDEESGSYLRESNKNARVEGMARRVVEIITGGATAAVVFFGSWQVIDGQMTLGSVVVFVTYLRNLFAPIRSLAKLSTLFSRAAVSVQRIAEVLEVEPEIRDNPDAVEATDLKGEIVFENVSFDYGDGKGVLKNVSFAVSPGQQVALVGASGAGKSTLASLILRLYDPQEGSISIDGLNIKDYRRESLRRQIGIVLQDSVLFGATIKENIAYGKLDASMEEIIAAAKAANAHDFILNLENGYDTVMGERGETLSGGQRRRVSIARALIRNASILILDEPMTGLDVESEVSVREAVRHLMAGKSCLLITHDLQAVADADLVLVLEEGRIIERGRHDELMALSGRYRMLYELQFEPMGELVEIQ